MTIKAIQTRYAGCAFRSRLEARWAVFFDCMGIPWAYEPEGFVVGGRAYLPDFYLPECGTWVEVKGAEESLDKQLMSAAAAALPDLAPPVGERGPRLMILGPIPDPHIQGDYGWVGLNPRLCDLHAYGPDGNRYGFGAYHKNKRPWWLGNVPISERPAWLTPGVDRYEWEDALPAYVAARSARFEHGQSGA